ESRAAATSNSLATIRTGAARVILQPHRRFCDTRTSRRRSRSTGTSTESKRCARQSQSSTSVRSKSKRRSKPRCVTSGGSVHRPLLLDLLGGQREARLGGPERSEQRARRVVARCWPV